MTTANVNLRQILLKRGNTDVVSAYTGPVGELVIDTVANSIRVQDGVTAGGHLVATTTSSTNITSGAFYANVDQTTGQVNIQGNIIPTANGLYSIGSSTQQFKNIFVAANTLYVGGLAIGATSSELTVNGTPISLTAGAYGNANVAVYLPTSSIVTGINANVTAANAKIVNINANITAANAVILSHTNSLVTTTAAIITANTAMKSYVDRQLSVLTSGGSDALNTLLELGSTLSNNVGFSTTVVTWLGNIAANIISANVAWTANAATQAGLITTLQSNAGVQSDAIAAVTSAWTANAGVQADAIAAVTSAWTANAGVQQTQISNLVTNANANTAAYLASGGDATITNLQNSIVYIQGTLSGLPGQSLATQASVDAANISIAGANIAWQENAASQLSQITGANVNISALQANLGGYYIWANANVAGLSASITTANTAMKAYVDANTLSQSASINSLNTAQVNLSGQFASLVIGANANTAAYLTTSTGNIAAGNITASSISVTSVVQYANLTTTQINAISPTSRGMTVFNYTTGNIQVYNGTKWANITLS